MNRLDKIVARNQRPPWYRNKPLLFAAAIVVALVMVALAAMTSIGRPHTDDTPPPPSAPAQHKTHVLLRGGH